MSWFDRFMIVRSLISDNISYFRNSVGARTLSATNVSIARCHGVVQLIGIQSVHLWRLALRMDYRFQSYSSTKRGPTRSIHFQLSDPARMRELKLVEGHQGGLKLKSSTVPGSVLKVLPRRRFKRVKAFHEILMRVLPRVKSDTRYARRSMLRASISRSDY